MGDVDNLDTLSKTWKKEASFEASNGRDKSKKHKKAHTVRSPRWLDHLLAPLIAYVSHVYQATKDREFWRLLLLLKSSTNPQNPNMYYEYH